MRNIFTVIVLLCSLLFAIDDISIPYVAVPGASGSSSGFNNNMNTLRNGVNYLKDTVVAKYPRWTWFSNHDSTFKWMNIDTISGKVRCDTIVADSLGIRILRMTGLPSGGTGDSCLILKSGVPTIISASSYRVMIGAASTVQLADSCFKKANKLHGVTTGYVPYANTDSTFNESCISASASKAFAPKLYVGKDTSESYSYNSNAELVVKSEDWTSINIVTPKTHYGEIAFGDTDAGLGRYSGRISYNHPTDKMLFSTKSVERVYIDSTGKVGINNPTPDSTFTDSGSFRISGNAKIGGHLNGATATYTGTVGVDSLKSTKGVSATTGNFSAGISATTGSFSSNVGVDSLRSTKGISGTFGRFSSVLFGDSATITKGISATIGRFSSIVFGDTLSLTKGVSATIGRFSSIIFGDSVYVTKGLSATIGRFSGALFGTSATFTGTVAVDSLNLTDRLYALKGVTTNNRDTLVYEDTTFYDSLYDGSTYRDRTTARIIRVGSAITLYQNSLSGAITTSTEAVLKGIPSKFKPVDVVYIPIAINNNSQLQTGLLYYDGSNKYVIRTSTLGYLTASANSGCAFFSATWIK
jgi:hypothetical protein